MSTLTPNYRLIVPESTDTVEQVRADYATNLGLIDNISGGGSANIVHLTQAEYDALPSSKLTDNKVYLITDAPSSGDIDFLVVANGAVNIVYDDGT